MSWKITIFSVILPAIKILNPIVWKSLSKIQTCCYIKCCNKNQLLLTFIKGIKTFLTFVVKTWTKIAVSFLSCYTTITLYFVLCPWSRICLFFKLSYKYGLRSAYILCFAVNKFFLPFHVSQYLNTYLCKYTIAFDFRS